MPLVRRSGSIGSIFDSKLDRTGGTQLRHAGNTARHTQMRAVAPRTPRRRTPFSCRNAARQRPSGQAQPDQSWERSPRPRGNEFVRSERRGHARCRPRGQPAPQPRSSRAQAEARAALGSRNAPNRCQFTPWPLPGSPGWSRLRRTGPGPDGSTRLLGRARAGARAPSTTARLAQRSMMSRELLAGRWRRGRMRGSAPVREHAPGRAPVVLMARAFGRGSECSWSCLFCARRSLSPMHCLSQCHRARIGSGEAKSLVVRGKMPISGIAPAGKLRSGASC